MSLQQHNYVATDADIRELTHIYISHTKESEGVKSTYLRALIGTTQKELGSKPRTNVAKPRKVSQEEQARQLGALAVVHARFYEIINSEIDKSLADVPSKERATEKNRRSNFARTALYAARLYVRAGRDLTVLAPGKLSKSAMAVALPPRPVSARRLKGRLERASKAFVTSLLELGEADKDAAVAELDTLIGIMANQLAALGVSAARNIKQAVEEHRPFREGATMFVPTQTTVLRSRARPS